MDEQDIFLAALDKTTSSERTAYLHEACGGNAVLLRRIEGLLQRHDDAGSFLERPAVELDGSTDMLRDTCEEGDVRKDDSPTAVCDHTQDAQLDFLGPSDKPDCLGTIGQYEINSIIGRGGMGLVLMAQDTKLLRRVAVKVLAPELAVNAGARQRFLREARAAAAVTHPHVVTIHAVDEDRIPYLVMEMVDGMTLRQKLDAVGMLEVKEILRIGSQIAHGLAAAHRQGLIHRDVKPTNVLLENGVERVKITDFGLARAINDVNITRTGEVSGTPQYMSPEQAQGEPVDHRSDLFSLGSVIYTMCSGRPPFRGDSAIAVIRRVVDDTPRPIREINDEIPNWLCEIVDKLLQKDPIDRYQTAAEVAVLLEQHLSQLQHGALIPVATALTSTSMKKSSELADSGASPHWISLATWRKIAWPVALIAVVVLVAVIGINRSKQVSVTLENKVPEGRNAELTNAQETNNNSVLGGLQGITSPAAAPASATAALDNATKQLSPQTPLASANPDLRAAEWVLSIGGTIHIKENDKERPIGVVGDLPQGAFELTGVNLTKNPLVSDTALAQLKDCKSLTNVVLDHTALTNAGLIHFKDCKNLTILGVGGTIVSDAGLAHLKDCKKLIGLWLYSTRVGDAGLAETVNELPNIKTLHLTYSRVSDAGLAHLKDSNPNLTNILLNGCQISDAGLEHLAGCSKLLSVSVENTTVTSAGVKKLSAALPRCTVRWDGGEIGPK